ncbi:helicase associated domain-containing protein [Nocardia sp. NPDC023852]|uniref:helicase associated domain-containing protein n=1 Tax=Nocardia sp. NPDC023852 TaxID=3154697 RepID=UPI0033D599DE
MDQHGHARVPPSCTIDDYKLGRWVVAQRRALGKGELDPERESRLDILPGWTCDPFTDQWEEGFRSALTYVDRNGDARIPQQCIIDGFQLGWWASATQQPCPRHPAISLPTKAPKPPRLELAPQSRPVAGHTPIKQSKHPAETGSKP